MKKAFSIICAVLSVVVIILSLVFCVIEARVVFSGDWILHENKVLGFLQYFLKTAFSLFAIFVAVATFIKKFEGIIGLLSDCLVVVTLPAFLFVTNGFGLYILILAVSLNIAVKFKTLSDDEIKSV